MVDTSDLLVPRHRLQEHVLRQQGDVGVLTDDVAQAAGLDRLQGFTWEKLLTVGANKTSTPRFDGVSPRQLYRV